jgi:hypothetical protein
MPRSKTMEQKRADWRKNKLQQSVNPKNLMCRAFESNFVLGQFGIVISKRFKQD